MIWCWDWNIEVARGRTYNNNYYRYAEFESSNLAEKNDAMIRRCLQRFIFHAQDERNSQNTQGIYDIKWNNSVIHSVTHSPNVQTSYQCCCISKCNAINHDATSVESFIQTILGFYAMDVWGGVHFIRACCRVWMNLQLPVLNNWIWVLIFDCVLCLKLCICNRVKHVRLVVIQTWCSDMD